MGQHADRHRSGPYLGAQAQGHRGQPHGLERLAETQVRRGPRTFGAQQDDECSRPGGRPHSRGRPRRVARQTSGPFGELAEPARLGLGKVSRGRLPCTATASRALRSAAPPATRTVRAESSSATDHRRTTVLSSMPSSTARMNQRTGPVGLGAPRAASITGSTRRARPGRPDGRTAEGLVMASSLRTRPAADEGPRSPSAPLSAPCRAAAPRPNGGSRRVLGPWAGAGPRRTLYPHPTDRSTP